MPSHTHIYTPMPTVARIQMNAGLITTRACILSTHITQREDVRVKSKKKGQNVVKGCCNKMTASEKEISLPETPCLSEC